MLTLHDAQDRAEALIARANRAGSDAADAVYLASASESVSVRLGKLEDVERSESEHIGLRVFVGRRSASIGSTDLSEAALDELAARAVAMARAAPEDPYAGLAPEGRLLRGPMPQLDIDELAEPSPQTLRAQAEAGEAAARAVSGVTNSEGAGAGAGRSLMALATSHGFTGAYAASSRSLSVSVVAGEGAAMQRDYAWRSAPPPASIRAGSRAARCRSSSRRASAVH
jgi:PmbA protein